VEPETPTAEQLYVLELEEKAARLVSTSRDLHDVRNQHDEVRRRLTSICVDYPDHQVCQPQTAAAYAREAFCSDVEFMGHVDEIVRACHQGQCRQVDDARFLSRTQYMTLVQRLPHSLVLFGSNSTRLDAVDRRQLQNFAEQIGAEGGYLIIVGRASRDGRWEQNVRLALGRAESTRRFVVEQLGFPEARVGYITYGHEKMYLTSLDAERMAQPGRRMTARQANRSAFVFAYPCYDAQPGAQ